MIPAYNPKLPRVIALSGWKGSGKDTAAEYLVRQYGYSRISFASTLKDMVANTYGVPREDLDNLTKKEMPLTTLPVIPTDSFTQVIHTLLSNELKSGYWTPRALCILEGSIKRSVYPNHWVKSAAETILNNHTSKFVISDMRYKSEVETLTLLLPDLVTIRINRFETINTTDPSERDLDAHKFTYNIDNTGVLEKLYDQLDYIVNDIAPWV